MTQRSTKPKTSALVTLIFLIVPAMACTLVSGAQHWAIYAASSLEQGQYWRLASCTYAHINAQHLAGNVAAAILFYGIGYRHFTAVRYCSLIWGFGIACGLLLWLGHPEVRWYGGMSGALHGIWSYLALVFLLSGKRRLGAVLAVCLLCKVLTENFLGFSLQGMYASELPVLSIVHLYGTLIGALWQGVVKTPFTRLCLKQPSA